MRLLSFVFFIALYLVFTHTNCGIESSYLRKKRENITLEDFGVFMVQINGSVWNDFDRTLLRGEDRIKKCLKDVDLCMENGKNLLIGLKKIIYSYFIYFVGNKYVRKNLTYLSYSLQMYKKQYIKKYISNNNNNIENTSCIIFNLFLVIDLGFVLHCFITLFLEIIYRQIIFLLYFYLVHTSLYQLYCLYKIVTSLSSYVIINFCICNTLYIAVRFIVVVVVFYRSKHCSYICIF